MGKTLSTKNRFTTERTETIVTRTRPQVAPRPQIQKAYSDGIAEPRDQQIRFKATKTLRAELEAQAQNEGVSMNAVCEKALKEYLRRHKNK